MDEDGITLVLARASQLRSKITNCIHRSSPTQTHHNATNGDPESEDKNPLQDDDEDEEEEEEAESLLNIRDAFESLESQLSSLQALQQQQWYEKGAALAEIDNSRKKLLAKLKEYKGEDLEVIHEATTFASETVDENNNDLLLPPYPIRASNNSYLSDFPSIHKPAQNGLVNGNSTHESEKNQVGPESKVPLKRARFFVNAAAKAVFTIVGVISVLSLAGFEPRIRKRDTRIKVGTLFGKGVTAWCPPGKVMVVEDGETRCLVKERVEIPFESVASMPDISYGCG